MLQVQLLDPSLLSEEKWSSLHDFYCKFFEDVDLVKFKKEALATNLLVYLRWSSTFVGFSFTGHNLLSITSNQDEALSAVVIIWNGPTILNKNIKQSRRVFYKVLAYYIAHLNSIAMYKKLKKYYFMMSEGIDSYMFMVHNFKNKFYPSPFQDTPPNIQQVLTKCGQFYGRNEFVEERGIILYENGEGYLKDTNLKKPYSSSTTNKQQNPYTMYYNSKVSLCQSEYLCVVGVVDDEYFANMLTQVTPLDYKINELFITNLHLLQPKQSKL